MAKNLDDAPLVSNSIELEPPLVENGIQPPDYVENPPDYFAVVEGCSDAVEITSIPMGEAPPSYDSLYPGAQEDLVEVRVNGQTLLVRGRVGLSPSHSTPDVTVTPEQIIRRNRAHPKPEPPEESVSPIGDRDRVTWRTLKVNGKPVVVSGRALAVQGELRRVPVVTSMVAVVDGPSWSSTRVTHLRHGGRGASANDRGESPKWPAKPPPDADGCCYCTMQWGQKIPCSYFVRSGGCLAIIATFCCVIPGLVAVMYAGSALRAAAVKGKPDRARRMARKSFIWSGVAIATCLLICLILIIIDIVCPKCLDVPTGNNSSSNIPIRG